MDSSEIPFILQRKNHIRYAKSLLERLPEEMASMDSNKLFFLYFLIGTLDVANSLEELTPYHKSKIIDYIYSQQAIPKDINDDNEEDLSINGFIGGPFLGFPFHKSSDSKQIPEQEISEHYTGNLIYTYPALCCLIMLGDDLSRVRRKRIIKSLKMYQNPDGSFKPWISSKEEDLRFVFSACAISYILNDFSGFDIDKTLKYILSCQNYDYAFGLTPNCESHGAATFLAIASLYILGKIDQLPNKTGLITWCINRQIIGFQGRINKMMDTCYAFWVGGCLQILGHDNMIDKNGVIEFLAETQHDRGGFGKYPESYVPDPVHTLHGLFGLSLINFKDLKPIYAFINLTKDTDDKIKKIHEILKQC